MRDQYFFVLLCGGGADVRRRAYCAASRAAETPTEPVLASASSNVTPTGHLLRQLAAKPRLSPASKPHLLELRECRTEEGRSCRERTSPPRFVRAGGEWKCRRPPQATSNRWLSVKFAPLVTNCSKCSGRARAVEKIFPGLGAGLRLVSSWSRRF
jgi:hypothetical protein